MQQLSWAMFATELKCTWHNREAFSLNGGPGLTKDNVSQVFTLGSITLKTAAQPLPPRLSQYPLIRASQVQFQMICVVSGVLPILKSQIFSVCCKRILVLHYSHLCALPRIPQKHNKDVFTAWDSCVLGYSLMLDNLDACHRKILQAV